MKDNLRDKGILNHNKNFNKNFIKFPRIKQRGNLSW